MTATIAGIPVYNALVNEEETGMLKISLVDDPAVMSNFQAFANKKVAVKYAIQDEEKRLVRGVVMRADFPIYRIDPECGEYYIIYKAETIRKMAEKYLLESRQNNVNLMHEEGSDVEGVQMVQFFIKDSAAGVDPAGFADIADGSLFGEFHITNDEVWEAVKDGTYQGFSLEGVFNLAPEQDQAKTTEIADELEGKFNKTNKKPSIMSKFKRIKEVMAQALAKVFAEFGAVTTDKGIVVWDGDEDLKEGLEVFVLDAEGNRTAAAEGDYTTEDNKVIVVVDGKVAEIKDPEAQVASDPAAEDAAEGNGQVEEQFETIDTDKGAIICNALEVGEEVFVETEEGNVPAEDGEYATEDKIIVVAEGKIAEIKDKEEPAAEPDPAEEAAEELRRENESLKAQLESLRTEVEQLRKLSGGKPAHEEVSVVGKFAKTGNKGLDRLAKLMQAE